MNREGIPHCITYSVFLKKSSTSEIPISSTSSGTAKKSSNPGLSSVNLTVEVISVQNKDWGESIVPGAVCPIYGIESSLI